MDDAYHDDAGDAEQHEPCQADASVEVEETSVVIPPARVEDAFHRIRCGVLHDGAGAGAREEEGDGVSHIAEQNHRRNGAGAVDGAVRSVQESAVDQPTFLEGAIDDLEKPAAEAVEEEGQEQKGEIIGHLQGP